MSSDMRQYQQLFIEEAKEHIDHITQALLTVEKDTKNIEAINSLFRSAHTLKCSSAMMGFKDIAELTHAMEDVFDGLRKGGQVSSELVSVLLECVDVLTLRLDKLQNGIEDEIDIADFLQKLKSFLTNCESKGTNSEHFDFSEKRNELKSSKECSKIKTENTSANDGSLFMVNVKLSKDCTFKTIRAIMVIERLSDKGEIIKIIPSKQEIDQGKIDNDLKILIKSKLSEKELKECAESVCEIEQALVTPSKLNHDKDKIASKLTQGEDASRQIGDSRVAQTVRIHFRQLDKLMNLVGELVINKIALLQAVSTNKQENLKRIAGSMDRLITELQDLVTQIRMVPVSQIFDRFPRLVRDLSLKKNKKITLIMEGKEIEVDRTVLDEIGEPLVHLIRNCVDHGIEHPEDRVKNGKDPNGRIRLAAHREGDHVIIEVEDDGAGINPELVKKKAVEKGFISQSEAEKMSDEQLTNLVFIPGFSTANEVTETSGRGVGMDVVKTKIESLGGVVHLKTEVGKGTKVTLTLPLTVAIIKSLLVDVGDQTFAIPSSQVSEVVRLNKNDVESLGMLSVVKLRGRVIPLLKLHDLLHLNGAKEADHYEVIVTNIDSEGRKYGLAVDAVLRLQEILIKPLDGTLSYLKEFSGATILGDGQVVLVLDIAKLIDKKTRRND